MKCHIIFGIKDFDREGDKKYAKFAHENGNGDLFRYDNVYRLTGVKYGVQNPENWTGNFDGASYADREMFNMDNVGNRTTVTNGTTTTYQTNNLNQYTAINGTNPTYDLNGNMTNDGYNQITYDYTNHPVRFDNADYTVEMRYDVLGRRIEKEATNKENGKIDFSGYVLDGARVISDTATDGLPTKQYIWGNGIDELLVSAKGRSREYDFYLNNSLGSITHIANKKAEVQESYKYKVYGTVIIFDKKGEIANKSKEKNRYTFTGREYEPEIKLYYYRARYLIDKHGSFLSRDLLGYVDSANIYVYVSNNPVNSIDSFGLEGKTVKFPSGEEFEIVDENSLTKEEKEIYSDPTGEGVALIKVTGKEKTKLSTNFKVSEFNTGNEKYIRLDVTLIECLQKVRDHLKQSLTITSGYRTPAYNKKVGGVAKSQHQGGRAADCKTANKSTVQLAEVVIEQCGCGISLGINNAFLHIDTRKETVIFDYGKDSKAQDVKDVQGYWDKKCKVK